MSNYKLVSMFHGKKSDQITIVAKDRDISRLSLMGFFLTPENADIAAQDTPKEGTKPWLIEKIKAAGVTFDANENKDILQLIYDDLPDDKK